MRLHPQTSPTCRGGWDTLGLPGQVRPALPDVEGASLPEGTGTNLAGSPQPVDGLWCHLRTISERNHPATVAKVLGAMRPLHCSDPRAGTGPQRC